MVFCTIFTALDLIRVDFFPDFGKIPRLLAWRLSRFRICFPLGFLDTHSRSKMPSKKFGARPPARPKNFFSSSRFSIADWKGEWDMVLKNLFAFFRITYRDFDVFPLLTRFL